MYKQILIPIDGSNTSKTALQEAIKLANVHHSRLRLIHIVDETIPYSDIEGIMDIAALRDALIKAGKTILDNALKTTQEHHIETESHLLEIVIGLYKIWFFVRLQVVNVMRIGFE